MAQNKQQRREILEIDVRLNELKRCFPFLKPGFYEERVIQLTHKKEELEEKVERGELAPDIQYLITEVEEG